MFPAGVAKATAGGGQRCEGWVGPGRASLLLRAALHKAGSKKTCVGWGMVCLRSAWWVFFMWASFLAKIHDRNNGRKRGAGEPYCKPDFHVLMQINLAVKEKAEPERVAATLLAQLLTKCLDVNTVVWLNKSLFASFSFFISMWFHHFCSANTKGEA